MAGQSPSCKFFVFFNFSHDHCQIVAIPWQVSEKQIKKNDFMSLKTVCEIQCCHPRLPDLGTNPSGRDLHQPGVNHLPRWCAL